MINSIKKKIKKEQNKSYIAKDFESFRTQLLENARIFFPDKIQDFSEASVGGMMLDFVATVGDSLSFYLDHSFRELDYSKSVESENIVMHLKNAGVEIIGAAPSVSREAIRLTIPSEQVNGKYIPKRSAMPVFLAGSQLKSYSGILFTTTDDVDFSEQDIDSNFIAEYVIAATNTDGSPSHFYVTRYVNVVSGQEKIENIVIGNVHTPFREITLGEKNITTILSITDSDFNQYYNVDSLSEDTIFIKTKNNTSDMREVDSFMRVIPCPYRYVKSYNQTSQLTTIRFGSGDADTLDDDIIPDPSELSLNLFGKTSMTKFNIDPSKLLQTKTLGTSPKNTTLTIRYRYGGGLDHNVAKDSIQQIQNVSLSFRRNPIAQDALSVRQSITATNVDDASGGDSAPSLDDLKLLIPSARKSQRRIVSREDMLARIYTLPSEFGRVYRASIVDNPINPLSALLYVISKDSNGNLKVSPDALKKNLQVYLNSLRLIGDAVDILDAKVINFGIMYSVYVSDNCNKQQVLATINSAISQAMNIKFFNIDQPIIIDDITNIIINSDFVISLIDLQIFPLTGIVENREYNTSSFSFLQSTSKGLVFPDRGSIFELKFPENDIIGSAY